MNNKKTYTLLMPCFSNLFGHKSLKLDPRKAGSQTGFKDQAFSTQVKLNEYGFEGYGKVIS
jgi:hypothetical protein